MIFIKRFFLWILIIIIFVVGVGFLLYSPIAKWLSSREQEVIVRDYFEASELIDDEDFEDIIEDTVNYNNVLQAFQIMKAVLLWNIVIM